MSRCNHSNAKYEIVIERWCDAYIRISEIYDDVSVTRDVPFAIKVQVRCPDCYFASRYNAYNPTICAEKQLGGAGAAIHWPIWLRNLLIPLRAQNAAVQEACLACGVLPKNHPAWK